MKNEHIKKQKDTFNTTLPVQMNKVLLLHVLRFR